MTKKDVVDDVKVVAGVVVVDVVDVAVVVVVVDVDIKDKRLGINNHHLIEYYHINMFLGYSLINIQRKKLIFFSSSKTNFFLSLFFTVERLGGESIQ